MAQREKGGQDADGRCNGTVGGAASHKAMSMSKYVDGCLAAANGRRGWLRHLEGRYVVRRVDALASNGRVPEVLRRCTRRSRRVLCWEILGTGLHVAQGTPQLTRYVKGSKSSELSKIHQNGTRKLSDHRHPHGHLARSLTSLLGRPLRAVTTP